MAIDRNDDASMGRGCSSMIVKQWYDLEEFRRDVLQEKISRAHVYNLAKEGVIPARRLGRRILIPGYYVEELMAKPVVKATGGCPNDLMEW